MVGVPVLFWVWVGACWPFTCVMAVGVGVSGFWWRVFQWWVAVVWASRRVPGVVVCVSWLVSGACLGVAGLVFGVGGLVWACFGVGWLVSGVSGVCAGVVWLVLVGVCWLVCVLWWFRMLTCLASFRVFGFVCLFVWLITVGVPGGGVGVGLVVFLLVSARVRVKVVWWGCGLVWVLGVWGFWCPVGYWVTGVVGCVRVWVCARGWCLVLLWGVCLLGVSGESGCLGAGCIVAGGVLPESVGVAVASGGVGVSFDVGLRVFVLSGVSVPASGSVSSLAPLSGSMPVSGSASASSSVPVDVAGGVRVCVPCAVRVFGDGWCSLVLRRWASAAGIDVGVAGVLSGSAPEPGSASGSVSSSPLSARSLANGGGRVGAGFGARVRDWGARVGVGCGVVSGGGVLSGWCGRWRERASGLASSVGAKGLVLAGLVGVVVLVSVLVLVG